MGAVTSTVAPTTSSSNTGVVIAVMLAIITAYFGPIMEAMLGRTQTFDGPTLLK
jgi:hypothetical protein